MYDITRQLQTAAELYAAVLEFKSDQAFNLPAPDPWISFTIGSVRVCKLYSSRIDSHEQRL
jgi:hypothetical protein